MKIAISRLLPTSSTSLLTAQIFYSFLITVIHSKWYKMSHTYPPLLCDILLTYQNKSIKNEQKSNKKKSYFSS